MRGFARAQRREEEELERKKNAYQEGAGLKWVVGKHCGVFAIEGVLALHERGALAYAARPEKGRGRGAHVGTKARQLFEDDVLLKRVSERINMMTGAWAE